MKRVLCLILAIVMAWCLAACGKDAPSPTEATPDESVAPTEKPEDPSDGYSISKPHKDIEWIYQKGAMYYSNDEGLWKVSEDGKPQQIVKGEVGAFSTDGTKVIYSAPVDDAEDTSTVCRIAVVNTDGTQDETLIRSEESNLRPITIYNDTIYYVTDTKDRKGKLMAWDKATSKEEEKAKEVSGILLSAPNKFYYTVVKKGGAIYSMYCYHTDRDQYSRIGNDEFKWTDQPSVYFDNGAYYTLKAEDQGKKSDIILYRLKSDDKVETADQANELNGRIETEDCLLSQSSVYYSVYPEATKEIYRIERGGGEPRKLTDTGRFGTLRSAGDALIYQAYDEVFYCNGDELKAIDGFDSDKLTQHVLWCVGETLYYADGKMIGTIKKQFKDAIPPVETDSMTDSVQIDGNRPASQENPYVTTDKEKTMDSSGSFYITGEQIEGTYTAKNRMPKVLLDSRDASQVNEEIQKKYGMIFEDDSSNEFMSRTDYVCYLNGNILSLAIEQVYTHEHQFQVYNFDVSSGKRLSNDELLSQTDITIEKAQYMIIQQTPAQYEKVAKIEMSGSNISMTEKYLPYAKYYFDSNKQLIALYTIWGTPGSGQNGFLLPLDAYYKG